MRSEGTKHKKGKTCFPLHLCRLSRLCGHMYIYAFFFEAKEESSLRISCYTEPHRAAKRCFRSFCQLQREKAQSLFLFCFFFHTSNNSLSFTFIYFWALTLLLASTDMFAFRCALLSCTSSRYQYVRIETSFFVCLIISFFF